MRSPALLSDRGCRVVTSLAGRSERTRALAHEAGIGDGGDLNAVVDTADIILSILPPAEAPVLARAVAACPVAAKERLYVDCNAVAPATAQAIGRIVSDAGFSFVDGGIVGRPPVSHRRQRGSMSAGRKPRASPSWKTNG